MTRSRNELAGITRPLETQNSQHSIHSQEKQDVDYPEAMRVHHDPDEGRTT